MKKISAESQRILVELYSKRAERMYQLKVVILSWKTKNVLGGQKRLKIRNWKHNCEHKKDSQNRKSLKQPTR